MIILTRDDIEALIDLPKMAIAIEAAYRASSRGEVNLPPVGHITFPGDADCHIKYGHMAGDPCFVIKVATGFPRNSSLGLPTGNGLVLVLSAETGEVRALLHDEMMLTDIRTGLGGAIASRALARRDAKRLLVVGTGEQARWQLRCHKALMPEIREFMIWGRSADRAAAVVRDMAPEFAVEHVVDLEQATRHADIIVTATGSRRAFLRSDWVRPGTHITAVGADAPGKQELDPAIIARAAVRAVDLAAQCLDHGEVSHAIGAGLITSKELVELGRLLESPETGRMTDDDITIADLTGIAAQDIAIANAVLASRNDR